MMLKKKVLHLTRNSTPAGGGPLVMSSLISNIEDREHQICGIFTKTYINFNKENSSEFSLVNSCPLPTTKDIIFGLKSYRISRIVAKLLQLTFPLRFYFKLRKDQISLVHTHYSYRIDLQAKAILKYLKTPMIWTVHSLPNDKTETISHLREFNNICKCHKNMIVVVTVSSIVKNFIQSHCPDVKVKLIYNGSKMEKSLKLSKQEFLNSIGIHNKNIFIVCSVARLNIEKGIEFLIQSAFEVTKHYKNIIFIHLGDGPLDKELKANVSQLNLKNNFFFLGHQKDVSKFLSISDLFVLPSLNEAFGLSLLEAMRVGLPSVVTNVGGIPEVTNQNCSIIVEPQNPKKIADAILQLYENKKQLNIMKKNALFQASKFTLDQMLDKYKKIYNHLINKFELPN